jgi:hypothetical protein
MNNETTAAEIGQLQIQKRESLYKTYVQLVERLATGQKTDPELAERILSELGKTGEQLSESVEKERKRIELKQLLQGKEKVEAELNQTLAKKEKLSSEYERISRPILNEIETCSNSIYVLNAKLEGFIHIEGQLELNYWNEMVLNRIETISKEMKSLANQFQTVQLERDRLAQRNLKHTEEFQWSDLQAKRLTKQLEELRLEFEKLLKLRRGQ